MKEEVILKKVLTENGSKITKPRLTIFRLMRQNGLMSLADLINHTDSIVDRVTVYRTVDLFDKLGIVRRVNTGWKYKIELSEIFLDHHHHISCLGCHKVVAVHEDRASQAIITRLAENTGFTVTSHQIELQGYCKRCLKTEPKPSVL